MGWFNVTHQPNLLVPSINRRRFSRWNCLSLEDVLYGKLASRPTCLLDTNDLLVSSDSFSLIPPKLEALSHSQKINRYRRAKLTFSFTSNHADLTLASSASEPLVVSVDSPPLCGPRSTPDPATDSHSLCLTCGILSNRTCVDCDQRFCGIHLYTCNDCNVQCCGDCLDAHHADGHWSDSDTASELAHAHHSRRDSCCRPFDSCFSNPASSNHTSRWSFWLTLFLVLRSLPSLFVPRLTASQSGACL